MLKQRDSFFDNFRGFLIWTIPISHFLRVGGEFAPDSFGGVIYITINVFVMQAFVFLSGYFSKKPGRAQETAFKTFLFPYLIFVPFFYAVRYIIFGGAELDFIIPPLALWYLVSLFFYRFFLKYLIKIKYILPITIIVFIFAGQVPFFDETLALGRTMSYLPFFMLGYYCKSEYLERIQNSKAWQVGILGTILVSTSVILAFCIHLPVGFYLLKVPSAQLGILWYQDVLMRALIFVLACGWIAFMFRILPKANNYLTYVGKNTMPIYILHLIVRYIVKKYGIYDGNIIIYYVIIFGLASLCVVVLSSPPVAKAYDKTIDSLYGFYLKIKCSIVNKK